MLFHIQVLRKNLSVVVDLGRDPGSSLKTWGRKMGIWPGMWGWVMCHFQGHLGPSLLGPPCWGQVGQAQSCEWRVRCLPFSYHLRLLEHWLLSAPEPDLPKMKQICFLDVLWWIKRKPELLYMEMALGKMPEGLILVLFALFAFHSWGNSPKYLSNLSKITGLIKAKFLSLDLVETQPHFFSAVREADSWMVLDLWSWKNI